MAFIIRGVSDASAWNVVFVAWSSSTSEMHVHVPMLRVAEPPKSQHPVANLNE